MDPTDQRIHIHHTISQNSLKTILNICRIRTHARKQCAESVGTRHVSGTGGQVDYVRGACQSRGGKSFIAFTSTAKDGAISKIKSILTPGAVVSTSKNDVDYIVTEYGVAHLRGRSLSERARSLIAIAHPNFRDELTFEAKKRGILI